MIYASMGDKTCLVTGASSGIGKETALALATMGATVVLHGRDPARSEAALAQIKAASGNPRVELSVADLSSLAEVRRLAEAFLARHTRLDVLVNNAGVIRFRREVTADGLEYTFALNHLAYFLLTHLLLDVLKASAPARVVNVSSDAHYNGHLNFGDLQSERGYNVYGVYAASKLANVLFTYELARRLEGTGVTANCLHPGFVASRFGKDNRGTVGALGRGLLTLLRPFALSPQKGAQTSIYLASSPDVAGVSGRYFANCKPKTSSRESNDVAAAQRLWQVSAELAGVEP
jgi:NAD(P)-dependent dehydrogenase (short-subunit alcohol dehydrogenase family)